MHLSSHFFEILNRVNILKRDYRESKLVKMIGQMNQNKHASYRGYVEL